MSQELLPLEGFLAMRQLDDGRVIGVRPMLYTTGLAVGITPFEACEYQYCYESALDCLRAYTAWDGQGDPPGPWLKLKGHPERPEEHGPGYKGFIARKAPG